MCCYSILLIDQEKIFVKTTNINYCEFMRTLEELVIRFGNINSFSHNREGIEKMARTLSSEIKRLKPDHFEIIALKNGPALFATKRAHAKTQVYLGGHFDTVHKEHWEVEKRGTRLLGPGVLDMKSGLAIMLKSLECFEEFEEKKSLGWRLLLNPDEEIGSPFSTPWIAKKARGCRAALIFEPSLPNHHLVSARKGSVNFLCSAKGKAAHMGRDFELGDCAITKLAHFIIGIKRLKGCVGTLSGGTASNVIADSASCSLNFRFDKEFPEEALKKLAASCCVKLKKESFRPPKPFEKKTKALFLTVKRCAEHLGHSIAWEKTGGVCDGNETQRVGTPTIDTLGGEGGKIHTRDEFLLIKSLEKKRMITTALLKHLATGEFYDFDC